MERYLEECVYDAAQTAYSENAYQIVGKIDGVWQYAHFEDLGRQAQMKGETYKVGSSGIF